MLESAPRARVVGISRLDAARPIHALYTQFAAFVVARLARFGVRSDDLRDLCHDVFLIVHQLRDLDQIRHIDRWLTVICRRTAARHHRSSRRRREHIGLEELPEEALADDSSAHELERRNLARAVRGAFELLDHESRELLDLHALAELPLTELSLFLRRDRKTVRKRLDVAKQRLTRLLQAD
jgi:RNA polymerase sigma factor (sigma-70 family)